MRKQNHKKSYTNMRVLPWSYAPNLYPKKWKKTFNNTTSSESGSHLVSMFAISSLAVTAAKNIVSKTMVHKLQLPIQSHLTLHCVGQIKDVNETEMTKQRCISFFIGKEVFCNNIVGIDACHMVRGRP